ncbi:PH domain-containing protein [Planomonospora parontospora]|uniref:PH domain-containing protein n=1 Tax=Planomonospora parontospora TaxID=58119 RepID=UPI00167059DC|nr:PH domain-containing protein [Planomonospora parontospora]GGL23872.1 membrane protein [Planomonospora parontospora subsp. antibiotica]GII15060.1 membrane protein [Planomonospora parontospora subsp. antibiotica]
MPPEPGPRPVSPPVSRPVSPSGPGLASWPASSGPVSPPGPPAGGEPPSGLRPPRHPVDGRAIGWWTGQALVLVAPPVLVLLLLGLLIPPARFWLLLPALVIAVPGLVYTLVMPRVRHRVHRWEITDDAVYTASGWIWHKWRVAPMSRIQTVDTVRGPIQQIFGLAGVTVTTASAAGAIKINGIDRVLAAELAERLTARTQAVPEDAA